MRKFSFMGFDVTTRQATIYDEGVEYFTGTTLEGIGQSVAGVLQRPEETANRFVRVLSIKTCQSELLDALEATTGSKWEVGRSTTKALAELARDKIQRKENGWVLPLVVAQLYDPGEARCLAASSWEESDSALLGVKKESALDVAAMLLSH
jgi:hypothetical protein